MFLFTLFLVPDVNQLGADDWVIREATECRLRGLGFLAWMPLLEARENESPEVRRRIYNLLEPYRQWSLILRAVAILNGEKYHPATLFLDHPLRRQLYLLVIGSGIHPDHARMLNPAADNWDWKNATGWVYAWEPLLHFVMSLEDCKTRLVQP